MFPAYAKSLKTYSIFGHKKINKLFPKIISTLGENFGKSIPLSCENNSETQSIYNFLSSTSVNKNRILLAENNRLKKQIESLPPTTFLGLQDTTEADFTSTRSAKNLGSLNYKNRKGLLIHNHILTDSKGVALGLFDQKIWSLDSKLFGTNRNKWPLEKKDSKRWMENFERFQSYFEQFPEHTAINICDRAADFYEMYEARKAKNVHLIVRIRLDRILANKEKLWSYLEQQEVSGTYSTEIRDAKKKKHEVSFEITFAPIEIAPSARAKRDQPNSCEPVKLNGILVKQVSPLFEGQEQPIVWRLFTTLDVNCLEDAIQIIEFYKRRWKIEEFHYALKQGAKIEKLQLKDLNSIENAITMYSLLACQVMNLRYAITKHPDRPIEDFGFTQKQFMVMSTYLLKKRRIKSLPKKQCETIEQFGKFIKLLATTSNPNKPPGLKSIWMGLKELKLIMEVFEIFT